MDEQLATWRDKAKVIVTIAPLYGKRSLAMNGFFHAYLFPQIREGLIAKGWNPEEVTIAIVKEYMKSMFLKQEIVNNETGEIMTRIRGTREMNKPESWEFCERCVRWASENLGVTLMMPGEQSEIDLKNE
jgi:hypothetical protein